MTHARIPSMLLALSVSALLACDLGGSDDDGGGWAAGERDAYVFFIAGAKVRNPAAAQALIARLGG